MKTGLVLGAALLAVLLLASPNQTKADRAALNAKERLFLANAKCTFCHTKPPVFNAFGKDFKRVRKPGAGMSFTVENLQAVENMDSDHDGWDNKSEFLNGTLPGDPKSHPKGRPPGRQALRSNDHKAIPFRKQK